MAVRVGLSLSSATLHISCSHHFLLFLPDCGQNAN